MTDPALNVVTGGALLPLGADPPAAGVRGATGSGLPYPTSQDVLADTAGFIQQLAQAIDYRLNNRSMLVQNQTLTTNGNGDMTITFPGFVTLQGLVLQPFANNTNGGADQWVLYPCLTGLPNNQANVHVWYANTKRNGWNISAFGGNHMYSIFAWGVPR